MASGRERYERQAEARRAARRAQRGLERRARRRRFGVIGLLVVLVVGSGVGIGIAVASGGSGSKTTTAAGGKTTSGPVCDYTADAHSKTASSPGLPPDTKATGQHTLDLGLGQGHVMATLSTSAPCTVNSFEFLSQHGFFTNTPCHRLTTSGIFVLQCGDPTGTGSGGPGYTIPDENLAGATYPAGTLAMANRSQPHTGGSQFFIVYKNTPLPPQYTPFGTITLGLDIVQKIAAAGVAGGGGDGRPKDVTSIKTFVIS